MNYNEMTAAQCADWLAEKDGWTWRPYAGSDDVRLWSHPTKLDMLEYRGIVGCDNSGPYKLTLDAAAGALREPWRLVQVDIWPGNVVARIERDHCGSRKCVVGPDRMTAEYRAAVAARMEEEHAK